MNVILERVHEPWFSLEKQNVKRPLDIVTIERLREVAILIFEIDEIVLDSQKLYSFLSQAWQIFRGRRSRLFDVDEYFIEFFIKDFANVRARHCNLVM